MTIIKFEIKVGKDKNGDTICVGDEIEVEEYQITWKNFADLMRGCIAEEEIPRVHTSTNRHIVERDASSQYGYNWKQGAHSGFTELFPNGKLNPSIKSVRLVKKHGDENE